MPRIAIIGRQNVGKSSLFNCLFKQRRNIEFDECGTTRDIIEDILAEKKNKDLSIADFPGFESIKTVNTSLEQESIENAIKKIKNYSLLLWVVHVKGLTQYEYELHQQLIATKKEIWLLVNFVDDPSLDLEIYDFYKLNLSKVLSISAKNQRNISILRTMLLTHFSYSQEELVLSHNNHKKKSQDSKTIKKINSHLKITIIGKPNAGKSTLINQMVHKEIALVSKTAGTTRDTLRYKTNLFDYPIEIIDTAGMRKKHNVHDSLEYISVSRARRAIQQTDVVFFITSIEEQRLGKQHKVLLDEVVQANKVIIFLLNKIDILDKIKDKNFLDIYMQDIHYYQKVFWKFPYFLISAKDKNLPSKVIKQADILYKKTLTKISTSKLNTLLKIIPQTPSWDQKVKLKFITQFSPGLQFLIHKNTHPIAKHHIAYIKRVLQSNLDLNDVPIFLKFRDSK